MSKSLFTYRDLVRIHEAVTPDRAPGRSAIEFAQIMILMADLADDGIEALQLMIRLPPFTIPRDLLLDLVQRILRLVRTAGVSVVDLVEEAIEREE